MKKIITLLILLGSAFFLSGCVEDDILVVSPKANEHADDSEGENNIPQPQTFDSFTFKSLTGKEDLTVTRVLATEDGAVAITTSPYNERYLAIAVYTSDCEVCKEHAVLFDRMAGELPHRNLEGEGTDFIIMFTDVSAETENQQVDWVQNLAHVDAYGNVATACSGGACRQVFLPTKLGPAAGTVYYVDKQDVRNTRQGITWTKNTLNYDAMQTEAARFMGLSPITFDAGVSNVTTVLANTEE